MQVGKNTNFYYFSKTWTLSLIFISLLTIVWYRQLVLIFLSSEEDWQRWIFQIEKATNAVLGTFLKETIDKKKNNLAEDSNSRRNEQLSNLFFS